MGQLHKLFSISSDKRQLFLYTLLLLSLIRLGLWGVSFQNLRSWLARSRHITKSTSSPTVETLVWAVQSASRIQPGKVKCLAQALTTQYLLERHGYAAQLRIGVAKADSAGLTAHAWVECQEKVVIGGLANLSAFTPLA